VWVIAIAIINTPKITGEKYARRNAEVEIKNTEIKFTCMPGIKPVIAQAYTSRGTALVTSKYCTFRLSLN